MVPAGIADVGVKVIFNVKEDVMEAEIFGGLTVADGGKSVLVEEGVVSGACPLHAERLIMHIRLNASEKALIRSI